MGNMRRCIFHIPATIEQKGCSGSSVRPWKMIKAFEENGYFVEVVMGEGSERKRQIKKIKDNIKKGEKYDFVYSETRNIPTLLTESDHVPRHPFLDFGFMRYCKKCGINIGLFYRDIFWKFPLYREDVPLVKRCITVPLFHYDLKQYSKYLSRLYLASLEVKQYINMSKKVSIDMLPPGCEEKSDAPFRSYRNKRDSLNLFYVGGIGKLYNITKMLKAVKEQPFVGLTLCCREQEWEANRVLYESLLCDRVKVVHKSGEELAKLYEKADICMFFVEDIKYISLAMPIKLFEYISYLKPVIATKGTIAGRFIEQNDIGWQVEFEEEKLKELLSYLFYNQKEIGDKRERLKSIREENSWKARAKKVINDLTNMNGEEK